MSGAFDRVKSGKLLIKLHRLGIRGKLLVLMRSWLDYRIARVVVNGAYSQDMLLRNMVY
jgi:hypothetical protein